MIWEIDKRFEFVSHHSMEDCQQLLAGLDKPGTSREVTAIFQPYRKGEILERVDFELKSLDLGGRTQTRISGTLQEGPDSTVVVSGQGSVNRGVLWLYTALLGILVPFSVILRAEQIVILILAPAGFIFAGILAGFYDRNALVENIFRALADQRKVKDKKRKRDWE